MSVAEGFLFRAQGLKTKSRTRLLSYRAKWFRCRRLPRLASTPVQPYKFFYCQCVLCPTFGEGNKLRWPATPCCTIAYVDKLHLSQLGITRASWQVGMRKFMVPGFRLASLKAVAERKEPSKI